MLWQWSLDGPESKLMPTGSLRDCCSPPRPLHTYAAAEAHAADPRESLLGGCWAILPLAEMPTRMYTSRKVQVPMTFYIVIHDG